MKLKMVCSLALPTVFLLTLLGCWPPHEPAKPNLPSPPGASASLQQGAEAQHWFENYYPADTPVQPVTFQQKYDGDFLAQGMADPVDAAYTFLQQSLSATERDQLKGWSFTESAWSTSGARILLVKQPAIGQTGGHMCIASLLLVSLFLKNANPHLISLHDNLVRLGIDPRTFTGQYEPQLGQHGVTQDDWNAIVGIAGSAYDAYVGSVYFIVAYQMERVLLPSASAINVDNAAAALVTRANNACHVELLKSVLQDAVDHAQLDTWGYEISGDGGDELTRLTSLGGC
jgi:hypothetical protein